MKTKTASTVKGMGIGMAIGGAAGLLGNAFMSKSARKTTKKNVNKAMRMVGDMLDGLDGLVK